MHCLPNLTLNDVREADKFLRPTFFVRSLSWFRILYTRLSFLFSSKTAVCAMFKALLVIFCLILCSVRYPLDELVHTDVYVCVVHVCVCVMFV